MKLCTNFKVLGRCYCLNIIADAYVYIYVLLVLRSDNDT